MDKFNLFIVKNFKISFGFFIIGLLFGFLYSINLLGYSIDSETLLPSNIRSIHISLMLYGFIPLMLSYLPFLLIRKEIGYSLKGLRELELYTVFWYIFLIFMIFSLLFGNRRELAFYDFPYELNFLLATAGFFYIKALYSFIIMYEKKPMWVNVSLRVVIIAPFMLIILMNPLIGQVEKTISGPHGDNTLGMSLALIPIYYLILKLISKNDFKARFNFLWIIPTLFYFASVLYKSFIGSLTYNEEWFLQYLTLFYIPLLYIWFIDSKVKGFSKIAISISIISFLAIDIEGNILFIPELRWLFHRNDLIIAHAHSAMGISVFFMVIAIFVDYIKELNDFNFYKYYLSGILGIVLVLSISGFIQAGFFQSDTIYFWVARTIFGLVTIFSTIYLVKIRLRFNLLQKYNLVGAITDGLGGILLIFLADFLYPIFDFEFNSKYEYVVFLFVYITGLMHITAVFIKEYTDIVTKLTILTRVFISSMFFSLYLSNILGIEALLISAFDFFFVLVYLILFYKKDMLCKE